MKIIKFELDNKPYIDVQDPENFQVTQLEYDIADIIDGPWFSLASHEVVDESILAV